MLPKVTCLKRGRDGERDGERESGDERGGRGRDGWTYGWMGFPCPSLNVVLDYINFYLIDKVCFSCVHTPVRLSWVISLLPKEKWVKLVPVTSILDNLSAITLKLSTILHHWNKKDIKIQILEIHKVLTTGFMFAFLEVSQDIIIKYKCIISVKLHMT